MQIIKFMGLLIVFFVPTVYGSLKSFGIAKRSEKLKEYVMVISNLCECIKVENIPKNRLLKRCFGITLLNEDLSLNTEFLGDEDINLLCEFLTDFGKRDKNSEYERTKNYILRLKQNCDKANEEKEKLCKLYSSLGILCGLSLCIFLI